MSLGVEVCYRWRCVLEKAAWSFGGAGVLIVATNHVETGRSCEIGCSKCSREDAG